ncbi:S41 family peptidase [Pedobacter sp.]|uniref:S41 family peptidase n=1 Tax=Pedobacter sp. TaxID=1411316 RepID=UPI003C35799C
MKKLLYLLPCICWFLSCQPDDDVDIIYEEGSNEYINQWMYEQMERYYYWNTSLPKHVDLALTPQEYLSRLLHVDDPFSYCYHPSMAETFPQSLRRTYGFDVGFKEHEGNMYAVVLYTLSGSPAQNAGLFRGALIKTINGTPLSKTNSQQIYTHLLNSDQADLEFVTYTEANGFTATQQLSIFKSFTIDQPIESTVIETAGKKIGYVSFSHFDVGMANSFMGVFTNFKSKQVSEVVLDLRYNGGGDVASAAALCAILVPGASYNDVFIKFVGNQNGGTIYQNFQEAIEMNELQVGFAQLRSAHPNINRVFVLCGNHTASASEIVINNLKPYMQVITIGKKTAGKDVAGFTIEDERNPNERGWVLYPSIYKLFNANQEGNYATGITPNHVLDELESLELKPLGNPSEALLKKALSTMN